MKKRLLISGGDERLIYTGKEFIKDGYKVNTICLNSDSLTLYNIRNAISESDVIITGLPITKDGVHLHTPLYNERLLLSDLINEMDESKILIGGMIPDKLKGEADTKGIKAIDYYLREELIIKNVIPTVEGALAAAINETPFTLHSSNCLVCGYGRIGKLLSKALYNLGARLTVSARKKEDFAEIECMGYEYVHTTYINKGIEKYDIIFNTIPYNIITRECIDKMKKDCLIIDLASSPGGLDFSYAEAKEIKALCLLSLPGKTAPLTAGKIIKDTILNILTELEE